MGFEKVILKIIQRYVEEGSLPNASQIFSVPVTARYIKFQQ
jgi:hypothetical protein